MEGSKDISQNAKRAMLEGARPLEMWTPIAILTQIKRMMPAQVYEIAKERYKAGFTLIECISPIVYKNCRWRDVAARLKESQAAFKAVMAYFGKVF